MQLINGEKQDFRVQLRALFMEMCGLPYKSLEGALSLEACAVFAFDLDSSEEDAGVSL